ncbi:DUF924 domain-containing protein [Rhodovulum sulfidophilum]|uniref:DUF924 domain-containing protein n=1 Tax=Rhodovulum sulfidophilum TaxID=35806 RepID=A0ABS1RRE7_RHOSU|nr:DUF924 family protein [Rhodovulum sulfidophilum]ANB34757.1 hypothetical protein A6W98_12215 [Rhodovulum sulfidophilum DSM 1374]ANB38580.1 hypothetical protein A6024_12080 [Rhodovulum sulfidophilum]MBK5923668.1 DUF924 domain-containing protein [Rhodovulum sulfidophilum]MBL3550833.1 DUF924 domain-containing protein [Rhodovulum sulfidophilum]MBL3561397.1 DUF924 domain-containing protein [Rhodovulum sulfidophilum]
MPRREQIISFWMEEVGPAGWYKADPEVDAAIVARFKGDWEAAHSGELHEWVTNPAGAFAFLILTDQFPRNMFRGDWRAFATDALARAASKQAIEHNFDMRYPEPERQFFYMPLMHSECLMDQDRCVRLMLTRMPETGADNLLHAKAHRELIRRFGRFPFRNAALHRGSSEEEIAFLESGGYGACVEELRASA